MGKIWPAGSFQGPQAMADHSPTSGRDTEVADYLEEFMVTAELHFSCAHPW